MNRPAAYAVLFAASVLLQVFLFDNLGLSIYATPMVYTAFIMLLPMNTSAGRMLFLGLLLGIAVDFLSGTAGLNTVSTLPAAFLRRGLLGLVAGREARAEGGIPWVRTLGRKKYLTYASVMLLVQCGIYFSFEAGGFAHYYLTLARTVCSAAVSLPLVWLISGMFVTRAYSAAADD